MIFHICLNKLHKHPKQIALEGVLNIYDLMEIVAFTYLENKESAE